jgi:hypothetical protein
MNYVKQRKLTSPRVGGLIGNKGVKSKTQPATETQQSVTVQ